MSGDGLQGEGAVFCGAGYGAADVVGPGSAEHAVAADKAPGGTEADEAAVVCGVADGAAGVLAEGCGAEEGGGGGAGAAAGGAGISGTVPRISGRAPVVIDAVAGGELAHVELAEQDCAGVFEVGDYGSVVVGNVGREDLGAAGGKDAGGVELVLDGHGHAVKGATMLACGDFRLGLTSGVEGVVAADGDVAVELAVDAVDSFQVCFNGFNGGDLLTLNQAAEGRGGQERDAFAVHWPICW